MGGRQTFKDGIKIRNIIARKIKEREVDVVFNKLNFHIRLAWWIVIHIDGVDLAVESLFPSDDPGILENV